MLFWRCRQIANTSFGLTMIILLQVSRLKTYGWLVIGFPRALSLSYRHPYSRVGAKEKMNRVDFIWMRYRNTFRQVFQRRTSRPEIYIQPFRKRSKAC